MTVPRPRETRPLPPQHRIVLDWLCRQPAMVHDFADVADALNMKRGEIEKCIADLKHQTYGAPLKLFGPDGFKLRPRHAYLPHESPARREYPPVPEVPPDVAEHPTIVAMRNAVVEEQTRLRDEAAGRTERIAARGAVAEAYRQRKLDARAKAAAAKLASTDDRYRTGFAEPPLGGMAPSSAAPLAPSSLPSSTAAAPIALPAVFLADELQLEPLMPTETPTASYKKAKK
jgi:hypothetical protein